MRDQRVTSSRGTYLSLCELRHTFATRLSAGGVADHFVTQMLRQGDTQVFKRYSQAKLNMRQEALTKLDRQADERSGTFGTARPNQRGLDTVLLRNLHLPNDQQGCEHWK